MVLRNKTALPTKKEVNNGIHNIRNYQTTKTPEKAGEIERRYPLQ
jgi:hypothetical protein